MRCVMCNMVVRPLDVLCETCEVAAALVHPATDIPTGGWRAWLVLWPAVRFTDECTGKVVSEGPSYWRVHVSAVPKHKVIDLREICTFSETVIECGTGRCIKNRQSLDDRKYALPLNLSEITEGAHSTYKTIDWDVV